MFMTNKTTQVGEEESRGRSNENEERVKRESIATDWTYTDNYKPLDIKKQMTRDDA